MAADAASVTFEGLKRSFTGHVRDLKGLLAMRGEAIEESQLSELSQMIESCEKNMAALQEQVACEKALIAKVAGMTALVRDQQDHLDVIGKNLPTHLPGTQQNPAAGPSAAADTKKRAAPGQQPDERKENSEPPTKRERKEKPSVPKLALISKAEFSGVSTYMKGRLSQEKVNNALVELQKLLEDKYKLLGRPTSGLSEGQMKRRVKFLGDELKETKGKFFFVEEDLRSGLHIKPDPSGRSTLTILRHLHRLAEVRSGGIIRYLAVPQ